MPRSSRVRVADLRAVYRIVAECRELGDDPLAWKMHGLRALCGLIGTELAIWSEGAGLWTRRPVHLGGAEYGWENGLNRTGWEKAIHEFQSDPDMMMTPPLRAHLAMVWATGGGPCQARSELMPDGDWYRSDNYDSMQRLMGTDHTAWCIRKVPSASGDEVHNLLLSRVAGRPDFTDREKAVVAEFHAQVVPLFGGPLARFAEPSPSGLPPRAKQVLRCLLEGDSDKQIAARLGVAVLSVNQHVKRVFAHFGVSSRAELLARWVKRGWGARFAWAVDP